MAFFVTTTNEENLSEYQGGNYINESGIYDLVIKTVKVSVNDKGARSLDFKVDYKGTEQVIYGLKLDNNDGSENFQRNIFNKLCVIAGIESIEEPAIESRLWFDLASKKEVLQDISVLTEFDDFAVKARIRFRYNRWNGQIREQKEIQGFYRMEDGAVANEIVSGENLGKQLAKDIPYSTQAKYDDGITEEEVIAWKASKKQGNSSTPTATQTTTSSTTYDNPFAK